jgi:hypothetical protein
MRLQLVGLKASAESFIEESNLTASAKTQGKVYWHRMHLSTDQKHVHARSVQLIAERQRLGHT